MDDISIQYQNKIKNRLEEVRRDRYEQEQQQEQHESVQIEENEQSVVRLGPHPH